MKTKIQFFIATLCVVLGGQALVWLSWTQGRQLVATAAVFLLTVILLGKLKPTATPGTSPFETTEAPGLSLPPQWSLATGIAAIGLSLLALDQGRSENWLWAIILIIAASFIWWAKGYASEQELPKGETSLYVLGVFAVAALFRLYQVGETPVGFAKFDEPLFLRIARLYLDGRRETITGDTGALPSYMQAFGLKMLGNTFQSYRLASSILSLAVLTLVYRFCSRTFGAWIALVVAFIWAVSLWPVTIGRVFFMVTESELLVVSFFVFLAAGLATGKSIHFAAAGLFVALSLYAYEAARISLVLAPFWLALVWWLKPMSRSRIQAGIAPALAAFLVGIAPLLQCFATQTECYNIFVQAFSNPIKFAGEADASALDGLFSLIGRLFYRLPLAFRVFWDHGEYFPRYFSRIHPMVHPLSIIFFSIGLSHCLARIREPRYIFLPMWFFMGLAPALMGIGAEIDPRRVTMSLLPMTIITGVGFVAVLQILAPVFPQSKKSLALALTCLVFASWFGLASWNDYFLRNQRNHDLLAWNRVNATNTYRAVQQELKSGPAVVIHSRKKISDSWRRPVADYSRKYEFEALNPGVPFSVIGTKSYYENEGLLGTLKWASEQKAGPGDTLVVLQPFHYYMTPLLSGLGGKEVSVVPIAKSNQGLVLSDSGMAPHDGTVSRIFRLPYLNNQTLFSLKSRLFSTLFKEISPPRGKSRASVRNMDTSLPSYNEMVNKYWSGKTIWKGGSSVDMPLLDPWYWMTTDSVPQGLKPPFRSTIRFEMFIEQPGKYRFGASSTMHTKISVNGKEAFKLDPFATIRLDPAKGFWLDSPNYQDDAERRRGWLGKEVSLKPGKIIVEVEQVLFSTHYTTNVASRLLWKEREKEPTTIPLEKIRPLNHR